MYKYVPLKRSFGWADIVVLSVFAVLLYGFVGLAYRWTQTLQPAVEIDLSPSALPKYAFFSLLRALVAYAFSLIFTLVYGYVAAKSKWGERFLVPLLDILQSIPVLGFLPGLVLGLISLFPSSNFGLELACILMIFTGQVWNMTFSYYSSLKAVPADLRELSSILRLSWFQRLRLIELPFSAIGLAWNSLMSMAGGWFYLTVCESFILGKQAYRLQGIGSYMAVAIEQNNFKAIAYGASAMCLMIVFVDFVIWRPVMAWVRKFQLDEIQEDATTDMPFVTTLLRESWIIRRLQMLFGRRRRTKKKRKKKGKVIEQASVLVPVPVIAPGWNRFKSFFSQQSINLDFLSKLSVPLTIAICFWGGTRVWEMIRTLTFQDWKMIWVNVGWTLLRVAGALVLASLWTIPVGIYIGRSARLTRIFQPIVQILASFPAPMLYPLVLAVMQRLHVSIEFSAMLLMLLGVQWYVLFNVLAGAMGIARDLKDGLTLMGSTSWTRWKVLFLPSIFPALVTGWVTAAGGAWNASFVAEYVHYGEHTLVAKGIGSTISTATAQANFAVLAGSLIAIVATVVALNRIVWRRLFEFAETRFR